MFRQVPRPIFERLDRFLFKKTVLEKSFRCLDRFLEHCLEPSYRVEGNLLCLLAEESSAHRPHPSQDQPSSQTPKIHQIDVKISLLITQKIPYIQCNVLEHADELRRKIRVAWYEISLLLH